MKWRHFMISKFSANILQNSPNILQKKISIICNNKIIRQGRLLLLSQKDFYITFTISIKGQTKKYEVPYPFFIEVEPDKITLDYRIDTICSGNEKHRSDVEMVSKKFTPNKFFDNTIEINLS